MTTIPELLPEFEEHIRDERQLAKNTVRSYRQDLRQFHEMVGRKEFEAISLADIRLFMRVLKVDGLTGATIRRKLHALSTFYEFQILNERVDRNLSKHAQRLAPRRKRRVLRKLLTVDEWRRFVETEAPNERNTVAWALLGWLGLRQSELRGLKVGDVDLVELAVIVRGKGGHERRLPLPDDEAILELITHMCYGRGDDDYLLLGDMGGYWSKNDFYDEFAAHVGACGLPEHVTPHWLRHTVATYMSQQITVFELKQWLGHKSTRTTELYVHHIGTLASAIDKHPLRKE